MMEYAVVVGVFVLVACCQAEAATNCHWGPSYWCQSKIKARECGETQYCQENVWKTTIVGKKQSPQSFECDACKAVIEFAENETLSNATEDKAKAALQSFCNRTGPLMSVCEAFVNDSFDVLWELLKEKLDPDSICTKIGSCASTLKKPLTFAEDKTCDICERVSEGVINLINTNATMTDAEMAINKVCTVMGGLANKCRVLIRIFFKEIWDAAVSSVKDPSVICQLISQCSKPSLKLPPTIFVANTNSGSS